MQMVTVKVRREHWTQMFAVEEDEEEKEEEMRLT